MRRTLPSHVLPQPQKIRFAMPHLMKETHQMPPRRSLLPLAAGSALLGGLALAACQWLIFVYAPTEATLGLPQKIFYLHLPLAWWGLFSFFITAVASAAFLLTRKRCWDTLAGAAAEVGLLLATLALLAGCFWAKSSWGIWWTWDARLSTTLIMCFVYAGYLIIRGMDMPEARRTKVAAVVGIVAFLDVPLVYVSARLWSYVHPSNVTLEPEMRITLFACVAAFSLLWFSILALRYSIACGENQLNALRTARLLDETEDE